MAADTISSVDRYRDSALRRSRVSVLLVLVFSLVAGALLLAFPPGWQALLLCSGIAFIVATWYRPALGVASVLGLTLLFEQYDFARFRPITRQVPFFENASQITGLKGFETTPLELMLVVLALVVLAHLVLKRRAIQGNPLAAPVLVFASGLVLWLAYGLAAGGQLNIAFWELRGFAYFTLLVLLLPQVLVTKRDVRMMLWVAILTIGVKAAQGVWNYAVVLRGDTSGVRSVTGHEDALFMAWMVVLLVAFLLYRTGGRQKTVLLVLAPVLALSFVFTDRRAAYVALAIGLIVMAVLGWTDRVKRSVILKTAVPIVLVVAFIVAAGWNSAGLLGRPAQTLRSISAPDNPEDAASNYYRRAEEVNLIHAIESSPVFGLGFGRPFQQPGQGGIVDIGFTLENVIPHNEIIWVWAKMGTLGFSLFWVMVGAVVVFGGVIVRTAREPYTQAVAAFVAAAMTMQVIVSYVDLQLTYSRNMVFLGVLVGTLASLPALAGGDLGDERA